MSFFFEVSRLHIMMTSPGKKHCRDRLCSEEGESEKEVG